MSAKLSSSKSEQPSPSLSRTWSGESVGSLGSVPGTPLISSSSVKPSPSESTPATTVLLPGSPGSAGSLGSIIVLFSVSSAFPASPAQPRSPSQQAVIHSANTNGRQVFSIV